MYNKETLTKLLRLAKYNIEVKHSVVGITERMEDTLTVMEAYLPRFFKGAMARWKVKVPTILLEDLQN